MEDDGISFSSQRPKPSATATQSLSIKSINPQTYLSRHAGLSIIHAADDKNDQQKLRTERLKENACNSYATRSIWKMLGPFTTASRLTPIHQMSLAVLSRAACASTMTTTTRDRGDSYGPMEWAQLATPLWELTCHVGWHRVTCHPVEVTFRLYPSQLKPTLDLVTPDICKANLT